MKRFGAKMIMMLALSACTSAPAPEQPAEADWVPCGGHRSYDDSKSYARYIRHVATLPEEQPPKGSTEVQKVGLQLLSAQKRPPI
jgi:hypothetical protein